MIHIYLSAAYARQNVGRWINRTPVENRLLDAMSTAERALAAVFAPHGHTPLSFSAPVDVYPDDAEWTVRVHNDRVDERYDFLASDDPHARFLAAQRWSFNHPDQESRTIDIIDSPLIRDQREGGGSAE